MEPEDSAIKLSKDNWWEELGTLQTAEKIPAELTGMLRSLISAMQTSSIPPRATESLIGLAKKHLSDGIGIGEKYHDVMVYIPNNPDTHCPFFMLIPKYPHGILVRISEI